MRKWQKVTLTVFIALGSLASIGGIATALDYFGFIDLSKKNPCGGLDNAILGLSNEVGDVYNAVWKSQDYIMSAMPGAAQTGAEKAIDEKGVLTTDNICEALGNCQGIGACAQKSGTAKTTPKKPTVVKNGNKDDNKKFAKKLNEPGEEHKLKQDTVTFKPLPQEQTSQTIVQDQEPFAKLQNSCNTISIDKCMYPGLKIGDVIKIQGKYRKVVRDNGSSLELEISTCGQVVSQNSTSTKTSVSTTQTGTSISVEANASTASGVYYESQQKRVSLQQGMQAGTIR